MARMRPNAYGEPWNLTRVYGGVTTKAVEPAGWRVCAHDGTALADLTAPLGPITAGGLADRIAAAVTFCEGIPTHVLRVSRLRTWTWSSPIGGSRGIDYEWSDHALLEHERDSGTGGLVVERVFPADAIGVLLSGDLAGAGGNLPGGWNARVAGRFPVGARVVALPTGKLAAFFDVKPGEPYWIEV